MKTKSNKDNLQLVEFDITRYLKNKRMMSQYLNMVIAEGDDAELAAALGHISRAIGMAKVAEASGLTREALYKALRPNTKPRFDTVYKVVHALGMKIAVQV